MWHLLTYIFPAQKKDRFDWKRWLLSIDSTVGSEYIYVKIFSLIKI